ncbi:MAG: LON peptidase substrate-binding domain-containing protein, partial [Pseudomonadota bacterium]
MTKHLHVDPRHARNQLLSMTANKTELPVLPLRNLVLFPGLVLPIDVGRTSSLRLIDDVASRGPDARLVVASQRDPQRDDPQPEDLHPIGVLAEILKVLKLSETRITVVLRGLERCRLVEYPRRAPYLVARIEGIPDLVAHPVEIEGLALAVRTVARQVIELSPEIPDETATVIEQIQNPGRLADLAAANLDLSTEERLSLLEDPNVEGRLERVLAALRHRVEVFRIK